MAKKEFRPQPMLFPNPTVLVGTKVDGRPNFATFAWAGIVAGNPPAVAIGVQPHRYTLKSIRQNTTFSVNIPSEDMVKEVDYCGTVSGSETDKAEDCNFKIFYGSLDSAPLIEQCPVNLECEVLHMLNLGSHICIIGRIKEIHASEECLVDGKPHIKKVRPILYSRGASPQYHAVGDYLGEPFSIGRGLKSEKTA